VLATAVDLEALGRIGTALADETRRQLLVSLLDGPGYPAELAEQLGLTRANVSNHLACLRGCGLVTTAAEGRRVRYDLADPRFASVLTQLVDLALPPAEGCAHDRRARG
jgi:ArsR family transcriptional regulator, cadmium/lead-responsive transcriptional repressor